nr:putative reverse transcriptase domain-containing protein [Tanacetum cinerariifolium]
VTANTNNANSQRGTELGQKLTCYECGVKGLYKRECPKLKNNNNQGNQGGMNNAPARVYAVGRAGADPDANVVTDQETINATSVTNAQLQAMIDQGVTAALAARDALRSTNGDDSHNSGTGVRRTERATRECTYTDFLNNYAVENQVKFATCTLHSVALTWWNTHVKTVGHEVAYGMPWKTLMKMMTDKYCPRNEIKKLEMKLWDLNVKGTDLASYTQRYQELALLSTVNTNNANNQKGTGLGQKTTCYECGVQIHFKRECPKMKNNNNHGNQGGRNNAPAKVYAVGRVGTEPDANVVTGTFLLNNRYASVLFDTGADKSFVSTKFSTQINITPSTLDHCYDIELADRRIIGLNTILRGCTLNLLNHPLNIDLMPIELGSFDAIICMDWLAKYQAVIACAEKIVHIPWGNETLIIHGDGRNQGNATRLSIISCTKTEKYVMKGFPIFLAHITTKEVEDKSEKKQLEDVPIV